MSAPTLAALFAEHQRRISGSGACICGEWPPPTHDVTWPGHLASVVAAWLREDAQVERAAVAFTRPEHGCDGTPDNCRDTCPVPLYQVASDTDLARAALTAVTE